MALEQLMGLFGQFDRYFHNRSLMRARLKTINIVTNIDRRHEKRFVLGKKYRARLCRLVSIVLTNKKLPTAERLQLSLLGQIVELQHHCQRRHRM